MSNKIRSILTVVGVGFLLGILGTELILSARNQSQTIDEANHIFAGYRQWKYLDFGTNPEHPPLLKYIASAPLMFSSWVEPPLSVGDFKVGAYRDGRTFVYGNNAETIIFQTRMAASAFTFLLAVVVFFSTRSMFGLGPAFLALAILVFEPNILANGALVTTDIAVSCGFITTIYCFYLYLRKKSVLRLMGVGLATGLTMATKHSGTLVLPALVLLAILELIRATKTRNDVDDSMAVESFLKRGSNAIKSFLIIGLISWVVLWCFYGFRFSARPAEFTLVPSLAEFAGPSNHPIKSKLVQGLAQYHLLPEAYIYGFVDIAKKTNASPPWTTTFLLGKFYPRAQWFYFPATIVIKTSLGLLLLILLLPWVRELRERNRRREIYFLILPPALYLIAAMAANINFGLRHILPIYPFLIVLGSFGAWSLGVRHRFLSYMMAFLIAFHMWSSAHAYPHYLAYSNEFWGGTANTYKVLGESNVDWGQGLKDVRRYMDEHPAVAECWIAYYGLGAGADPSYYGITCKPLPTFLDDYFDLPGKRIPLQVEGTIFVSASELYGRSWGPGSLNPYHELEFHSPKEVLAGAILVYEGRFELPLLSSVAHQRRARRLLEENGLDRALVEAKAAVALSPQWSLGQYTLGKTLSRLHKYTEARQALKEALKFSRTIQPEYQQHIRKVIEVELAQLPQVDE